MHRINEGKITMFLERAGNLMQIKDSPCSNRDVNHQSQMHDSQQLVTNNAESQPAMFDPQMCEKGTVNLIFYPLRKDNLQTNKT